MSAYMSRWDRCPALMVALVYVGGNYPKEILKSIGLFKSMVFDY